MEKRIDSLIEAGWSALGQEFDRVAFLEWKEQAFRCLNALLGEDHAYIENFHEYVHGTEEKDLLATAGLLTAVKEQMANGRAGALNHRNAST